jgi:hypothetical protein
MADWSTAAELPASTKQCASKAGAGQIWRSLAIQFRDPRCWQILSLALLLIYGLWALGFDQSLVGVAAILICALMVQWIGCKGAGIRPHDPLSALISGCSSDRSEACICGCVDLVGSMLTVRRDLKARKPVKLCNGPPSLNGLQYN